MRAAVTPQPPGKETVARDRRSFPERKTQLDGAWPGGVLQPAVPEGRPAGRCRRTGWQRRRDWHRPAPPCGHGQPTPRPARKPPVRPSAPGPGASRRPPSSSALVVAVVRRRGRLGRPGRRGRRHPGRRQPPWPSLRGGWRGPGGGRRRGPGAVEVVPAPVAPLVVVASELPRVVPPHPLASAAGTRATRPVNVASRTLCTAPSSQGRGGPCMACTSARPACWRDEQVTDIFATVPMLTAVLAASGTGSPGSFTRYWCCTSPPG